MQKPTLSRCPVRAACDGRDGRPDVAGGWEAITGRHPGPWLKRVLDFGRYKHFLPFTGNKNMETPTIDPYAADRAGADPYAQPTIAGPIPTPEIKAEKPSLTSVLFSFHGRVRRTTFWCYSFASQIACIAIIMGLGIALGPESPILGPISLVASFAVVWISFALQVKRWHDRDKSGWWVLISMVPIIGPIWALIEAGFLPGTQGANRFGPDPRQS